MKSLDMYKDAVYRRAEQKRRERLTARKRLLAVCLPLCLCIGIAAAACLPQMLSVSSDHAPESSDGSPSASVALKATVSHGTASWSLTNAEQIGQLYSSLQTLCASDEDASFTDDEATDATVADLTNGSTDSESAQDGLYGAPETAGEQFTDTEEDEETPCYRITFSGESEASFLLENRLLTDLASGETLLLTLEQLSTVTSLLEP